MTHFCTLVIVLDVADNDQAVKAAERLLAPFDENIVVPEYVDEYGDITTRNPLAKYDYYQVGGRYSMFYPQNVMLASIFPDIDPPVALLTPDKNWHELGRPIWFGQIESRKQFADWSDEFHRLLAPYTEPSMGAVIVVMDLHI